MYRVGLAVILGGCIIEMNPGRFATKLLLIEYNCPELVLGNHSDAQQSLCLLFFPQFSNTLASICLMICLNNILSVDYRMRMY